MQLFPCLARLAASGALLAIGVMAAPVGAQDASPAAGAGCTAEPRDVDELVNFYFSPEGTPLATPAATTFDSEAALPAGEPVDAETEAAVNAVVMELIACFDAGQYARAFALVTDDAARSLGPDMSNPDEDTPDEVRALLEAQIAGTPVIDEPGMEPGTQTQVSPGRDVRLLEGGRVGGVWEIEGDAAFAVLEQVDDRWLVDEFLDIVEDDAMAGGTPTP
ncbi:MAG: hypothetical protein M3Q50_06100 [Chloroflexota bacterium]|nr:hypothetical protein [Chloroflexia bacterium]MDQ3226183.1 hypothetical protein [Chloroflexota bacterium]